MKKIEEILKTGKLDENEIDLLKRIDNLATKIERDIIIIYQGEWNTAEDMKMLASVREELPRYEEEYKKLRPISTVVMLDPVIKEKYDTIQKVDETSYYHGFQHIKNVVNTMKKFIDALGIDDTTADKLLTAIIFHDIGRTNVGKDHDKNSAKYFIDYIKDGNINELFSRLSLTELDIYEIKTAILLHEQKEDLEKLTDFQLLVNFTDKLDVTKERINLNNQLDPERPSYKFDVFRDIYLDINAINPIIEDGSFVLEFECNENMSLERLYSIPFMQVVDKLHKEFARRNNLEAKVRLNPTILKSR